MDKQKYVYLDHAATTPPAPQVVDEMNKYLLDNYANANSLHSRGQEAKDVIEKARQTIADLLNSKAKELFFTSGATESNNWVLKGLFEQLKKSKEKLHFVISTFEHPAVKEVAHKFLSEQDQVEITYIDPDEKGIVSVDKIKSAINDNTVLVSLMYANNEIGTVQPIAEVGNVLKKINEKRQKKIYFHTDATQVAVYLDLDVNKLGVDFLTLSAHKMYGPKGVGLLYIRDGVKIKPLLLGGHQEGGKRAGTYNVPAIAGFAKAVEIILEQQDQDIEHALLIKGLLLKELQEKLKDFVINGDLEKRLMNNLNISIAKVEGESVLFHLDDYGIAISTGSACASGDLGPSPVLAAIGVKPEDSHGSIRITWGRDTSKEDIIFFVDKLVDIVEKLRKMSPLK